MNNTSLKTKTAVEISTLSRRKFLHLSGQTLIGGALLASINRIWATSSFENKEMPMMPQKKDGTFEVAPLPYAYNALEPTIDAETMHFHHDKHYATYTKNLNEAVAQFPELKSKSIIELLSNIPHLPAPVQKTIRNNGGGYYNHSLFWHWMMPHQGEQHDDPLGAAIQKSFGSLADMKEKFNKEATSLFGSGWVWLVVRDDGRLEITSTPNQDNPLMKGIVEKHGEPILGLDLWEHAYYLKYKNDRAKYIDEWWKLVNWKTVSSLYAALEHLHSTKVG